MIQNVHIYWDKVQMRDKHFFLISKQTLFLNSHTYLILLFLINFFLVVQVQLSPFSSHHSPHPTHPHPHPRSYSPLTLSMCPLYMFLDDTSPISPPLSLSLLPSGYHQFVLYFSVSGYILLASLFCWLGSTYRWDHMVFVFHHLAYFT